MSSASSDPPNFARRRLTPAIVLGAGILAGCMSGEQNYSDNPVKAYKATTAYLSETSDYANEENLEKLSVGRIDLGRKLFNDKRLSLNGNMACSTCHVSSEAYTQNKRATPVSASGKPGPRNAPSLYDVVQRKPLMWDGRATQLEQQAMLPLINIDEMANPSVEAVTARIRGMKDYDRFFQYAFGGPASPEAIAVSLAAFQRTLITGPSRFDLWKFKGRKRALNSQEKAGYALFVGKGGCVNCHTINATRAPLTDDKFHRIGYGEMAGRSGDRGRLSVSGQSDELYAFRTPTLRNIALTGPYMHDGRLRSLEAVVEFFNETQRLALSQSESDDLVAFLKSLTSRKRPN